MPEHNPGQMGGTMRLGKRETFFVVDDCKISKLTVVLIRQEELSCNMNVLSFLFFFVSFFNKSNCTEI